MELHQHTIEYDQSCTCYLIFFYSIVQDFPLLKICIYLVFLKRKLYENLFEYMCLQTSACLHNDLIDRRCVIA